MSIFDLTIRLPDWTESFTAKWPERCDGAERRMEMAIALARENVRHRTGGPFGAVVFDQETHRWLGLGMNLVTHVNCSILHAEMVALALAQKNTGRFDLSAGGQRQLVTTCEPCAMCLGAIPWSGVCSVVCGARDEDARIVGFDEGDKPPDWISTLRRRGIDVVRDVLRDQAVQVLQDYAADGGPIYNAGPM